MIIARIKLIADVEKPPYQLSQTIEQKAAAKLIGLRIRSIEQSFVAAA